MSKESQKKRGEATLNKLKKALGKRGKSPKDLAAKAGISYNYAAGKLKALAEAGAITVEKKGREAFYSLPSIASHSATTQAEG